MSCCTCDCCRGSFRGDRESDPNWSTQVTNESRAIVVTGGQTGKREMIKMSENGLSLPMVMATIRKKGWEKRGVMEVRDGRVEKEKKKKQQAICRGKSVVDILWCADGMTCTIGLRYGSLPGARPQLPSTYAARYWKIRALPICRCGWGARREKHVFC